MDDETPSPHFTVVLDSLFSYAVEIVANINTKAITMNNSKCFFITLAPYFWFNM